MNCSGKHAAMLLTCLANDWPLSGYLAPRAPAATAAGRARSPNSPASRSPRPGWTAAARRCSRVSLLGLARAFRQIATGAGRRSRVAEAMRGHPELVGGEGRQVTTLMRPVPGLIAKDGAEGVFAAALPDGGAVAVKIDDGAMRAADCAVAWALHHLGVAGPSWLSWRAGRCSAAASRSA